MEQRHKLYFFKCPNCGEYPTSADMFKQFCSEKVWRGIQNRPDASGCRMDFKDCCPKCKPSNPDWDKSQRAIILLKRKRFNA